MSNEYIQFSIDKKNFLFPICSVIEIAKAIEISSVPLTPREIIGISLIHGKAATVIDLKYLLCESDEILKTNEVNKQDHYLVFSFEDENYAFNCNDFKSQLSIEDKDIIKNIENLKPKTAQNTEGYTSINNHVYPIISPEKIIKNILEKLNKKYS